MSPSGSSGNGACVLPAGWQRVPLGQVGEIVSGVTLGRKLRGTRTRRVPYLRVANVKDARLDLSDVYEIEAGKEEIERLRLRIGDLLLTEGGDADKLGRGTLWRGELPLCIHQNHIFRVRFDPQQFWPEFVAAQIASPYGKAYFLAHAKQTTGIATINQRVLAGFPLLAPPFAEQQRIASILREQLAVVERARAAADARLAAAVALPNAYLRGVFETSEALAWPRQPIEELGDPSRGDVVQTGPFGAQLPSSEFTSAGVPVLNIGNVHWGRLDLTRLDHVKPEKAADLDRYRLHAGDLLFTRSGTVGRSAVVPSECQGWLMSYHLLRVAFDRGRVCPEFMVAAIRGAEDVRRQVRRAAGRGATRDGVNSSILASLRVPIPPLEAQQKAVSCLRAKIRTAENMIVAAGEGMAAIQALPAALLGGVFGGPV